MLTFTKNFCIMAQIFFPQKQLQMNNNQILLLVAAYLVFAAVLVQGQNYECDGCTKASILCNQKLECMNPSKLQNGYYIPCVSYYSVRVVVELDNYKDPKRYYPYCIRVDELTQISVIGCTYALQDVLQKKLTRLYFFQRMSSWQRAETPQ